MSNYKTTICQNPDCPNTIDSRDKGRIVYDSHCVDINMEENAPPVYVCLPCGYKCGGVG
jgi:hypothetical protein